MDSMESVVGNECGVKGKSDRVVHNPGGHQMSTSDLHMHAQHTCMSIQPRPHPTPEN